MGYVLVFVLKQLFLFPTVTVYLVLYSGCLVPLVVGLQLMILQFPLAPCSLFSSLHCIFSVVYGWWSCQFHTQDVTLITSLYLFCSLYFILLIGVWQAFLQFPKEYVKFLRVDIILFPTIAVNLFCYDGCFFSSLTEDDFHCKELNIPLGTKTATVGEPFLQFLSKYSPIISYVGYLVVGVQLMFSFSSLQ